MNSPKTNHADKGRSRFSPGLFLRGFLSFCIAAFVIEYSPHRPVRKSSDIARLSSTLSRSRMQPTDNGSVVKQAACLPGGAWVPSRLRAHRPILFSSRVKRHRTFRASGILLLGCARRRRTVTAAVSGPRGGLSSKRYGLKLNYRARLSLDVEVFRVLCNDIYTLRGYTETQPCVHTLQSGRLFREALLIYRTSGVDRGRAWPFARLVSCDLINSVSLSEEDESQGGLYGTTANRVLSACGANAEKVHGHTPSCVLYSVLNKFQAFWAVVLQQPYVKLVLNIQVENSCCPSFPPTPQENRSLKRPMNKSEVGLRRGGEITVTANKILLL
ncbi:hypothetical protein EVAR_55443_1 [Eumeta japonica]|uniref:Uncharacterized protein n=1 Tax=Eumeta variegata TaxID=151549 RepID=A0A4C1Y557_EUMVA|nr:hypothetical protein EVAR_55443_1 [Eumeta japonica]